MSKTSFWIFYIICNSRLNYYGDCCTPDTGPEIDGQTIDSNNNNPNNPTTKGLLGGGTINGPNNGGSSNGPNINNPNNCKNADKYFNPNNPYDNSKKFFFSIHDTTVLPDRN